MLLVKHLCGFDDKDMAVLARNAVTISWADPAVKEDILREIDLVYNKFYPAQ
jgi:adenosine deaminase